MAQSEVPPPAVAALNLDVAAFLRDKRSDGARPRTIALYSHHLRLVTRRYGSSVSREDLDDLAGDGSVRPGVRLYTLKVLSRYRSWARDTGRPLPQWRVPRGPDVPPREPRVWNKADWTAFKDVARRAPQPAGGILCLLCACALRSTELLTLPRADLAAALQTGILTVVGKGYKVGSVPIVEWARPRLRGLLDIKGWKVIGDLVAPRAGPSGRGQALIALVAWACREAGMKEPGTPHEARHNIAVEMMRNGATLEHVRRMLRHTTIFTLKFYTELSSEDLLEFRS